MVFVQDAGQNAHFDGILRSLRSSDHPGDVRAIGLLRSLRSDQDFPIEVHRDAMLRSLRSLPTDFLQERELKRSRSQKPNGENEFRNDAYGLTLRYL